MGCPPVGYPHPRLSTRRPARPVSAEGQDDDSTEDTETYELDHATMTTVSPAPTDEPRRSESGNELADIDRALRALAGHVGELRR